MIAPPGTQHADSSGEFETPVCFGYLGRLVTEKGLPVLLRASRELALKGHSFRLKIVGSKGSSESAGTKTEIWIINNYTLFVTL